MANEKKTQEAPDGSLQQTLEVIAFVLGDTPQYQALAMVDPNARKALEGTSHPKPKQFNLVL